MMHNCLRRPRVTGMSGRIGEMSAQRVLRFIDEISFSLMLKALASCLQGTPSRRACLIRLTFVSDKTVLRVLRADVLAETNRQLSGK